MTGSRSFAPSTRSAAPSLAPVRGGVTSAFSAASEALQSGQGLARGLLAALADEARRNRDAPLSSAPARLERALVRAADRRVADLAALGQMQERIDRAAPHIHDLARTLRLIDCHAGTARVIEVGLGGTAFSDRIRHLGTRAREALANIRDRHGALGAGIAALAPDRTRRTEKAAPHITPPAQTAAAQRATARIAGRADRRGQRQPVLHGADSFDQRVDHVGVLLTHRLLEGCPAAEALVRRIAAAQLQSAQQALSGDIRALCRDLAAQGTDLQKLVEVARQLDEHVTPLAADRRRACERGLAQLAQAGQTRSALAGGIAALTRDLAALTAAIAALGEIETDLRLAAMNALLHATRAQDAGAAMTVVASQYGAFARDCATSRGAILAELDGLPALFGTLDLASSAQDEALARLRAEIAAQDACAALPGAVAALLDEGPALQARCAEIAEGLRRQDRMAARTLAALSDRLIASAGTGPASSDAQAIATALRPLYSLPEERAVHDRICGQGRAP